MPTSYIVFESGVAKKLEDAVYQIVQDVVRNADKKPCQYDAMPVVRALWHERWKTRDALKRKPFKKMTAQQKKASLAGRAGLVTRTKKAYDKSKQGGK